MNCSLLVIVRTYPSGSDQSRCAAVDFRRSHEHNLAIVAVRKTESVLLRREHSVRVIPESAECFIPKEPSEERVLIAECIGNRMCRNNARTLREVIAKFDSMCRRCVVDVGKLAR